MMPGLRSQPEVYVCMFDSVSEEQVVSNPRIHGGISNDVFRISEVLTF